MSDIINLEDKVNPGDIINVIESAESNGQYVVMSEFQKQILGQMSANMGARGDRAMGQSIAMGRGHGKSYAGAIAAANAAMRGATVGSMTALKRGSVVHEAMEKYLRPRKGMPPSYYLEE